MEIIPKWYKVDLTYNNLIIKKNKYNIEKRIFLYFILQQKWLNTILTCFKFENYNDWKLQFYELLTNSIHLTS